MQALYVHVDAALDRVLQEQHALSVRELGALEILGTQVDEEDGHFQMRELAHGLSLSQSATTRLVSRLEERGLLRRHICPTDRRGIYTDVTDSGLTVLSEARVTRDSALDAALGSISDARLEPLVNFVKAGDPSN